MFENKLLNTEIPSFSITRTRMSALFIAFVKKG